MYPVIALKFELLYIIDTELIKLDIVILESSIVHPQTTAIPNYPYPIEILEIMLELIIYTCAKYIAPIRIPFI